MVLHLLHIHCYRYSLAQNLSQIKPTIDKEREISRIRDKILVELLNNGAKIRSDVINRVDPSMGGGLVGFYSETEASIEPNQYTNGRSKELVTLGEPVCKYSYFIT